MLSGLGILSKHGPLGESRSSSHQALEMESLQKKHTNSIFTQLIIQEDFIVQKDILVSHFFLFYER
jgi:hypothetical protein